MVEENANYFKAKYLEWIWRSWSRLKVNYWAFNNSSSSCKK